VRSLNLTAVVLTVIALMPGAAHVFELPGKLNLPQQDYFVVQQIYRGWAWFGTVIIAAGLVNLALTIVTWRRGGAFRLHALALIAVTGSLIVFFVWVYPANQAAENWTVVPTDWDSLRRRWEYGHLGAASLMFVALCSSLIALYRSDDPVRS